MSLLSARLDAREEDPALEVVKSFCAALIADAGALRELVMPDFTWLGHALGRDPEQLAKVTDWMSSGRATTSHQKLLSASLMTSLPPWIAERAFGPLVEGDRIGLFDLRRDPDLATIGLVIGGRGAARDRVRRAFDPGDLVRMIRLAKALL
jgi:hypothetical protein